jgi:UDP-N-acetylmuramoyl-tripeptide--D-alanyl-D-alanine ligase
VQNSLAVLASASLMGVEPVEAARNLAQLKALKGRGLHLRIGAPGSDFTLIDESYNASPAAMRAALDVLGRLQPAPGGRRIAVLGDMRELGADADRLHGELASALGRARIDLLLACGAHMAHLVEEVRGTIPAEHAADSTALLPMVVGAVAAGDVVLVKGSLGSRMAPIVEALMRLGAAARVANGQ